MAIKRIGLFCVCLFVLASVSAHGEPLGTPTLKFNSDAMKNLSSAKVKIPDATPEPDTSSATSPGGRIFFQPAEPEVGPSDEFYVYYRTKWPDTFESLAHAYQTRAEVLAKMNPSAESEGPHLKPGQILCLPNPGYQPPDREAAYLWNKIRGRPYPTLPPPPPPEPEPDVELPRDPLLDIDITEDPDPDEWKRLMAYGIDGKNFNRVTAAQQKGRRRHLTSRRGRHIYKLLKSARGMLGVPYVWGGEQDSGADCSGFVQLVFARNGIKLPRTADIQYEFGRRIPADQLQPGDLVFFETYAPGASHVGIYLGRDKFIHASSGAGKIVIGNFLDKYFQERYLGARRHI